MSETHQAGAPSADHMKQATDLAAAVLRDADTARYADRSTCPDYDVRGVANHLVYGFELARLSAEKKPWGENLDPLGTAPRLAGVPVERWAEIGTAEAARTAAAWAEPDAWEGEVPMSGGSMPAAAMGAMMLAEFVVHGWDLAVSTGQDYDCPPALADAALEAARSIAQMGRDGGWFGPEVPVPEDAPTLDRVLGVTGRDPRWKRP